MSESIYYTKRNVLADKRDTKFVLIRNGIIVSQNDTYDIYKGDILIRNNTIEKIGTHIEPCDDYKLIDVEGKVLTPYFYNMHVHLGETIFRGRCDGMNLWEYLDVSHNSYDDSEWMRLESQIHRLSGLITIIECIENGVGCISCNRGWEEIESAQIQALCAYPIVKIGKLMAYYDGLDDIQRIIERFESSYVEVSIFLQSLYLCDEDKLEYVAKLMEKYPNMKLFIHVAETEAEMEYAKNKYDKTPFETLMEYGLLTERTYCVHSICVSEKDIELIKKTNTNIILCPVSNMKLGDGFPNVQKYLEHNIPLCVATDGFATNNSGSLLEELKLIAIMLHGKIDSNIMLDMITKNPAKALRRERSGVIAEGMYADIAIFDTEEYNLYDIKKIPNQMIYNNTGFRCSGVINKGNVIFLNGKINIENVSRIKEEYTELLKRLFIKDR